MNEVEKLRGLLTRCDEYLAAKGVIYDAKLRREIRAALSRQAELAPAQDERAGFDAYMLGRAHPVIGWISEHWFKRGDDPTTYANDYVQGAWVLWQSRPAQTEQKPVPVPEGWTLAPMKPTKEMLGVRKV